MRVKRLGVTDLAVKVLPYLTKWLGPVALVFAV
jgi:hypothetical protein